MCIYRYTSRPCEATRVLHVAFNHDKGSFYNRLLEEVTVLENCQEKKSSHLLSHRHQRTRENSLLKGHTACVPESRILPSRALFPTTTRHSFTRQTVERPCSQHLFATETALLPILLLHGERCRPAEAPQKVSRAQPLNVLTSQGRSSSTGWVCGRSGRQTQGILSILCTQVTPPQVHLVSSPQHHRIPMTHLDST